MGNKYFRINAADVYFYKSMNRNNFNPLIVYFVILSIFCFSFILGSKMLGQKGAYLAQGYMLTPAIAAFITRMFFYRLKFKNANLHFGKLNDYLRYWVLSLMITILSFVFFTIFKAITWDFSEDIFLDKLTAQFTSVGPLATGYDYTSGNLDIKFRSIAFYYRFF